METTMTFAEILAQWDEHRGRCDSANCARCAELEAECTAAYDRVAPMDA